MSETRTTREPLATPEQAEEILRQIERYTGVYGGQGPTKLTSGRENLERFAEPIAVHFPVPDPLSQNVRYQSYSSRETEFTGYSYDSDSFVTSTPIVTGNVARIFFGQSEEVDGNLTYSTRVFYKISRDESGLYGVERQTTFIEFSRAKSLEERKTGKPYDWFEAIGNVDLRVMEKLAEHFPKLEEDLEAIRTAWETERQMGLFDVTAPEAQAVIDFVSKLGVYP